MVQAVPDAVKLDGSSERTIWEGTHFPDEGPGRGRERRKRRGEKREEQEEHVEDSGAWEIWNVCSWKW